MKKLYEAIEDLDSLVSDEDSSFVNVSTEALKNSLPGKRVEGRNGTRWEVYGIFTAFNGKDYVAMKKTGSFADPNLVELERFKKTYKLA